MVITKMVLMVGIASNSDSDVDSGDIQDDGEIENLVCDGGTGEPRWCWESVV